MPARFPAVIFLFLGTLRYAESLYCLQCNDVISPRHCHTVRHCNPGEVCFTEQHVDVNGQTMYHTGCYLEDVCNMRKRNVHSKQGNSSMDQDDTLQCVDCCSSNVCNSKGCGTPGYPDTRGPLCFSCSQSRNPELCASLALCASNQVCKVQENSEFGETFYSSGCASPYSCRDHATDIFGKRSTGNCVNCCGTDLCNDACGKSLNSSPFPIQQSTPVSPTNFSDGSRYLDCYEAFHSGHTITGIYTIYPWGKHGIGVDVLCDMDFAPGGWTVFQNRFDGSEVFDRNWQDYKLGFGSARSEYWLGNEAIFQLTKSKQTRMHLSLTHINGSYYQLAYNYFYIGSEANNYQLTVHGPAVGNAVDYMVEKLSGSPFQTPDTNTNFNFARDSNGGWWFRIEDYQFYLHHYIYLNGEYGLATWTKPWYEVVESGNKVLKTRMMLNRRH